MVTEYFGKNIELKKGDIITHIEGKTVEAIVDSMKKYYPASNEAARLREITKIYYAPTNHAFTPITYHPVKQGRIKYL